MVSIFKRIFRGDPVVKVALEDHKKPLAVIIKGNPVYLDNHEIAPMAETFYDELKQLLENKGFEVTFDAGAPHTLPDISAKVWVAHSRGIDRLDYAPKSVTTLALKTNDSGKHDITTQSGRDASGKDPKHYQLSAVDIKTINAFTV